MRFVATIARKSVRVPKLTIKSCVHASRVFVRTREEHFIEIFGDIKREKRKKERKKKIALRYVTMINIFNSK